MFECVIVLCVDGENRFRHETLNSSRDLKRLASRLERLVLSGKCEKFCIMFSGEITRGF